MVSENGDAEPELVPAGFGRRIAARVIDAPFVLAATAACLVVLALLVFVPVGDDWLDSGDSSGGWAALAAMATLGPPVLYEVYWTQRRGSTTGKRLTGVKIVRWPHGGPLTPSRALARFAAMHAAPAAATLAALPLLGTAAGWTLLAAGATWWALVGLSPLVDRRRRGWHDKATGTVAIAHDPPSTGRVAIRTAIATAAVLAIPAAITATAISERNERQQRQERLDSPVHVAGPGEDSCEIQHGKVSCDLASIGTRWQPEGFTMPHDRYDNIYLGEGIHLGRESLCAVAYDGTVQCWEWDDQTPPRPGHSPDGIKMHPIVGTAHVVCGHDHSGRRFVCWTVGTDRPYQEFRHALPHRQFSLVEIKLSDRDGPPELIFYEKERSARYTIPHNVNALSDTRIVSRR